MEKYIFRREKFLKDSRAGQFCEDMLWPQNADGCEAFFEDEQERGHTISRTGSRLGVRLEWCEVVEDNEDALATALNP